MTSQARPPQNSVSPGNPCPFLRALVAEGRLANDTEAVSKVASTLVDVAKGADGGAFLPYPLVYGIALIANGLGPSQMLKTGRQGLQISKLRDGPLNKKGAGSGILDAAGHVSQAQLERLKEFASSKTDLKGNTEPGLNLAELVRMMDANFERAKGRRRAIDRKLMDGEWPVLLKVMGKRGKAGRYLSLQDVRALFEERRLPQRMRT